MGLTLGTAQKRLPSKSKEGADPWDTGGDLLVKERAYPLTQAQKIIFRDVFIEGHLYSDKGEVCVWNHHKILQWINGTQQCLVMYKTFINETRCNNLNRWIRVGPPIVDGPLSVAWMCINNGETSRSRRGINNLFWVHVVAFMDLKSNTTLEQYVLET